MYDLYSAHEFEEQYTYTGNDLGFTWTPQKTTFRLWAPTAEDVLVNLYRTGDIHNNNLLDQIHMHRSVCRTCGRSERGLLYLSGHG